MARFACALALLAGLAASASADIPPPPPANGFKRVPYVIVMRLEKEIPGYKFYTYSQVGLGGKETVRDELKLGTEGTVAVPSSSSPSVRTGVLAVPDAVTGEYKTKDDLAKLISRKRTEKLPAGVVVYDTRGTSADLRNSDPRTKLESVVTISPDEKAGVKFTAKETPAPRQNAGGEADEGFDAPQESPALARPALVIAGGAVALAIVTLGVWLVRRK